MKGRYVVLGAALALGLIAGGCGGGGNGSSNRVSVSGDANFPEANGGQPVANSRFVIINPDRPNDPLSSDVSTDSGRFFGVIRKTVSVAVILSGNVDNDDIRVSGLIPAEHNNEGNGSTARPTSRAKPASPRSATARSAATTSMPTASKTSRTRRPGSWKTLISPIPPT